VGHTTITAADLNARLAEQPFFDQRGYMSTERRKQLLESMIRSELLVQEARRRGLDKDPEVKSTVEKLLVQKLGAALADEADRIDPIPASELRRAYDQRKHEFVSPTRVRVSHLFLAAPEKDPKRARAAAEAARLLQQIRAKEVQSQGQKQVLELTASQRSDDAATKATGGDLGYRTRDELAQAWGAPFADAAHALKTPNEVGPVVTTPRGIHLVKLLGRQEGYEVSFEAAKARLEPRLKADRRSRSVDDLVAELKKKTGIRIDEEALRKVDLGPTPGAKHDPRALSAR
jgi:peptidyl-prolyl cis-trans isomerase C